jgi:hypothetical protein
MEQKVMTWCHSQLTIDLAKLAREDKMRSASKRQLILEAKEARPKGAGIVAGTRRIFGGAIISLGQAVRGERLEAADAAPVSNVSLRMAR